MVKVTCSNCHLDFEKNAHDAKRSVNHFCSRSCAAVYNNRKFPKRKPSEPLGACKVCNAQVKQKSANYCSIKCQQLDLYQEWVRRWLAGEETGVTSHGGTSGYIKRYLIDTRGNKCEECGWCETNPVTGKVPIQLEHIDGDFENNHIDNLKLLCPNCHSLTPTFGSLNTGNGRRTRVKKT